MQIPLTKVTSIATLLICVFAQSLRVSCDTESLNTSALAQELNRARLIEAARAGGDYLVRVQKRDGSFNYYYDAETDRFEPRRYNILRHAGAAIALFDLFAATHDARYLESARHAVRFLTLRFRPARASHAVYVLDYDGKAKLGANGLALIAMTRQMEAGGGLSDRANALKLANLILAMQRKDGSFDTHYKLQGAQAGNTESLYYPGEAMLGLMRLFKLTGDNRLLEAACRGANYLIDRQRAMGALPADAWLMQALEALCDTGDRKKSYVEHAIALAEAMMAVQYTDDDAPGYSGGFGPGPPRGTPGASRSEGLLSAYRLARSTGDARATKIATALRASAIFQLSQQLTRTTSGVSSPAAATGGFREDMTSMKVRIDYVQHNISSLLGIAATLY